MNDVQIHWFSIVNSLVVVFFLSGILTMIMIRTLRRDIAKYNTDDNFEDTLEETGWKLVHGDVFRPPKYPRLFSAIIGSGIQIFFMALITICKFTLFLFNIFLILTLKNYSCSNVGNVITEFKRCFNDISYNALCIHGINSWLFFCKAI